MIQRPMQIKPCMLSIKNGLVQWKFTARTDSGINRFPMVNHLLIFHGSNSVALKPKSGEVIGLWSGRFCTYQPDYWRRCRSVYRNSLNNEFSQSPLIQGNQLESGNCRRGMDPFRKRWNHFAETNLVRFCPFTKDGSNIWKVDFRGSVVGGQALSEKGFTF